MNEVRYVQAGSASTFSAVLIAGMLAVPNFPAIAQPAREHPASEKSYNKNMTASAYRASAFIATYSHIGSPFAGKYGYSTSSIARPWLTSELEDFIVRSPQLSLEALDLLLLAIHDTYGNVRIDAAMRFDPEEEWAKPVFTVYSGVEDFDLLMDIEDSFFAKASSDQALLSILPFVVVSPA